MSEEQVICKFMINNKEVTKDYFISTVGNGYPPRKETTTYHTTISDDVKISKERFHELVSKHGSDTVNIPMNASNYLPEIGYVEVCKEQLDELTLIHGPDIGYESCVKEIKM